MNARLLIMFVLIVLGILLAAVVVDAFWDWLVTNTCELDPNGAIC